MPDATKKLPRCQTTCTVTIAGWFYWCDAPVDRSGSSPSCMAYCGPTVRWGSSSNGAHHRNGSISGADHATSRWYVHGNYIASGYCFVRLWRNQPCNPACCLHCPIAIAHNSAARHHKANKQPALS